jgi:hypothetical protein
MSIGISFLEFAVEFAVMRDGAVVLLLDEVHLVSLPWFIANYADNLGSIQHVESPPLACV